MMEVDEKQGQLCPSWDNLPSDILLIIFESLPMSSLSVCMFVSERWRNHVEHVIEVKKMWGDLFNISEFKIKCEKSLDWRQMYHNYVLWHSIQNATINLHDVQEINQIKKITVYRNHMIVVTCNNVQYHNVKALNAQSSVEWLSCEHFYENDFMAVKVFRQDDNFQLQLLPKDSSVTDIAQTDVLTVENVICYKIHNDECHVLDHRNVYSMYTIADTKWRKKTGGRYYGNPNESCDITVIDNEIYLMLQGGSVLWIDNKNGHFQKMIRITNPVRKEPISKSQHSEAFNRKMFLWCYMHEDRVCSHTMGSEKTIERLSHWSNPMCKSIEILLVSRVSNVCCMLQHGDILFLGHFDGTVDLISSREISRKLSMGLPMRRFNIKDFKPDLANLAVLSIDVFEEEGIQHMFIATDTHVLHLHVTHTNCEDYMWSEQAY